jgi:hypothetical protein
MSKKPATTKQMEQARGRMLALLRSPKTKAGLVLAVHDLAVSPQFVQGWLVQQVNTGLVLRVQVPTGAPQTYVLSKAPLKPEELPSNYPTWLEPRAVPDFSVRRYVSKLHSTQEQEESESTNEDPRQSDSRPELAPERLPARRKRP